LAHETVALSEDPQKEIGLYSHPAGISAGESEKQINAKSAVSSLGIDSSRGIPLSRTVKTATFFSSNHEPGKDSE
jgi:hypothetical protein